MTDQSRRGGITLLLTECLISLEIIAKILKKEELNRLEIEEIKVYSRNPQICSELAETLGFLESLSQVTFSQRLLLSEGLKVFINISTNESSSRATIAKVLWEKLKEAANVEQFLVTRLLFLLSIEREGAEILINCNPEFFDCFFKEKLEKISDDKCEDGKIIIDLLRYRYNLLNHRLVNYEKCMKEAKEVLSKCPISFDYINIIGSCLNIYLTNDGPVADTNFVNILEILEFMMEMYTNKGIKDYLGTVLMISVQMVDEEESKRAQFRRHFLHGDDFLDVWKRLLLDSNTNISFLCGELLYKMCKGNTVRLTRHIGFESLAGYFYSKGILNEETIVGVGQPESLSSDEEYFHENPEEEVTNNGSLIPETEEEEAELEYLMQKITEYNARSERK